MNPSFVAHSLFIDAQTAVVVGALRRAGLEPILLKGPSFAQWLYDGSDRVRNYVDTDLLVDPDAIEAAEKVLTSLGYSTVRQLPDTPMNALAWRGPAGNELDLHAEIWGWGDPHMVWRVMQGHTSHTNVQGVRVRALDEVARCVHVATHALQNSYRSDQANEDLRRAVRLVPEETWRRAAELAAELGALDEFSLGLNRQEEAQALRARIGVHAPVSLSPELRLKVAGEDMTGALAVERFIHAPGWRYRAIFVWRRLWPPRDYAVSLLAAQGRVVHSAPETYLAYWAMSAKRIPSAIRAWKQAPEKP